MVGELTPPGGPVMGRGGGQEKDWCCVGAAQDLSLSAWCLSILNIRPRATHGLHSTRDNTEIPEKRGWGQTRRSPLLHRVGVTPSAPPRAMPHITAQTLHGDLLWGWGVRVCWMDPNSMTPWGLTTHRTGMASPQRCPEAPSSLGQGSPGLCDLPGEGWTSPRGALGLEEPHILTLVWGTRHRFP